MVPTRTTSDILIIDSAFFPITHNFSLAFASIAHCFWMGLPLTSPTLPFQDPSPIAWTYTYYEDFSLTLFSLHTFSLDKIIHMPEFNSHFYMGGFLIYNFWTEDAQFSSMSYWRDKTNLSIIKYVFPHLCLHLITFASSICPLTVAVLERSAFDTSIFGGNCIHSYNFNMAGHESCQIYISRCVCSCLLNRCVR